MLVTGERSLSLSISAIEYFSLHFFSVESFLMPRSNNRITIFSILFCLTCSFLGNEQGCAHEEEEQDENGRLIFIFGYQFNAQLAFHTGSVMLGRIKFCEDEALHSFFQSADFRELFHKE